MNKIIEFFKALITKTGKTKQKSEEVQTSQNTEVDSLKSTETVKKVETPVKEVKRRGRPRKVKAE